MSEPEASLQAPSPEAPAAAHPHDGLPAVSPDFVEYFETDQIDNAVPTRGYQMLPMVALGGSAGSVAALQKFFSQMPADSGMVFVVILHLSPTHHSTMAELLARTTANARDAGGGRPEGGAQPRLRHPAGQAPCHHQRPPAPHRAGARPRPPRAVDFFFRSLADTHGPHAAAVVLSGADGDGAIGIKRIKERGGLTIVQDPDEAEHPSMPRTSVDTGMVDWVLGAEEIPHRLLKYFRQGKEIKLPPEDGPQPAQAPRHVTG